MLKKIKNVNPIKILEYTNYFVHTYIIKVFINNNLH